MEVWVGDTVTANVRGTVLSGEVMKREGSRLRVMLIDGKTNWIELKDVSQVAAGKLRPGANEDSANATASESENKTVERVVQAKQAEDIPRFRPPEERFVTDRAKITAEVEKAAAEKAAAQIAAVEAEIEKAAKKNEAAQQEEASAAQKKAMPGRLSGHAAAGVETEGPGRVEGSQRESRSQRGLEIPQFNREASSISELSGGSQIGSRGPGRAGDRKPASSKIADLQSKVNIPMGGLMGGPRPPMRAPDGMCRSMSMTVAKSAPEIPRRTSDDEEENDSMPRSLTLSRARRKVRRPSSIKPHSRSDDDDLLRSFTMVAPRTSRPGDS